MDFYKVQNDFCKVCVFEETEAQALEKAIKFLEKEQVENKYLKLFNIKKEPRFPKKAVIHSAVIYSYKFKQGEKSEKIL